MGCLELRLVALFLWRTKIVLFPLEGWGVGGIAISVGTFTSVMVRIWKWAVSPASPPNPAGSPTVVRPLGVVF